MADNTYALLNAFQQAYNPEFYQQVEAENQRKFDASQAPLKALLAAGLGYATGGLGSTLMGSSLASALAPSVENILPAITTGLDVLENPEIPAGQAALYGVRQGIMPTINEMEMKKVATKAKKMGLIPKTMKKGEVEYGLPMELTPYQRASLALKKSGGTKPPVTMGRLSEPGASFFSTMQSAIDNKEISYEDAVKATLGAKTVPPQEKAIIIKNYKRFGGM